MKVVLDTNVVVSGICFPKSVCGSILLKPLEEMGPIWSSELIAQVFQVISRSKLDRYAPLERRLAAAHIIFGSGQLISLGEVKTRCRAPKDDHVVQLAIDGGANYIVTGDQDLLVLSPVANTRAVTSTQFLTLIHGHPY